MPARRKAIICKNCGVRITITQRAPARKRKKRRTKKKRTKSLAKQEIGRRLAASLPRDAKGKFLPRGSTNLFRGAKGKGRTAEFSTLAPSTKRRRFVSLPGGGTKELPSGTVGSRFEDIGSVLGGFIPVEELQGIALTAAQQAVRQGIAGGTRSLLGL